MRTSGPKVSALEADIINLLRAGNVVTLSQLTAQLVHTHGCSTTDVKRIVLQMERIGYVRRETHRGITRFEWNTDIVGKLKPAVPTQPAPTLGLALDMGQASKVKRPSYRAAIEWLALNAIDPALTSEDIAHTIIVAFTAEMFGVTTTRVTDDICRCLDRHGMKKPGDA